MSDRARFKRDYRGNWLTSKVSGKVESQGLSHSTWVIQPKKLQSFSDIATGSLEFQKFFFAKRNNVQENKFHVM